MYPIIFVYCRYRSVPFRMVSSGKLRCVALIRPDVSEELSASFIMVTRIGELGTALVVIPEDAILHSHRRESLKSYTVPFNLLYLSCDQQLREK
jgi:hypothetical protein